MLFNINAKLTLIVLAYAACVCNIDRDALLTDEAARQKLFEYLIIAKNKVRHVTQGRVVMYVGASGRPFSGVCSGICGAEIYFSSRSAEAHCSGAERPRSLADR